MKHPYATGQARPLGAHPRDGGVNFSLYAEHATAVELLLFENADDLEPRQVIALDARAHHSVRTWHVFVHGIGPGQLYGYRVDGPAGPGLRYDRQQVLLDPYALEIVDPVGLGRRVPKSRVLDPDEFDWGRTRPPHVEPDERVIYELHVGTFTRHPSSGAVQPGTFEALMDRIPYLVDLGVTTVELLPVFAFDDQRAVFHHPDTGRPVLDVWGYNPLSFFAPHPAYAAGPNPADSFRSLVRALHHAGLEVILDVVFNHTGEGGEDGPTTSLRGIDNPVYYLHRPDAPDRYADYSGCGNTLNCNHPAVRRLILDSLRHWAGVCGVDGFRFDLASILSRDSAGRPLPDPPLLWEIETDPTLARVTLIAEAWDAGGLYQVGSFPGERWREWNGRFRDDVRRFLRGDEGTSGAFASRLLGSPDIYEPLGRQPASSVNFVTSHDGFTLADLVSYDRKHNEANGEGNRDGHDGEFSFNHGTEGPSDDPAVQALRERQVRNFLTALFVAQGTPMLLAGDELGRTQRGNNNAWCQDSPLSWMDWNDRERSAALHRFVRALIERRRSHPNLRRSRYLLGTDAPESADPPGYPRVRWHGTEPGRPNWASWNRVLAYSISPASDDVGLYVAFNSHTEAVPLVLPEPLRGDGWLRAVDTALPSPEDASLPGFEASVGADRYTLAGRSALLLVEDDPAALGSQRATQILRLPTSDL